MSNNFGHRKALMAMFENEKQTVSGPGTVVGGNVKLTGTLKDVNDITNGSFLLADEGGIEFSSRKSMSKTNQLLSELLMISRHNDISVLFISQTSANIEINTLRQADYIILKQPSLLQLDFERKKIREIYSKVEGEFKKYEKDRGACYLYSHEYMGFISNMLPSFWNSKVSKGYRKIT